MNTIDVSVSVISFNTKKLTQRCLESIFKYTKGITFEIIVVDNGSTDGSVEMLQQLEKKHKELKVIYNKKNHYFSPANNQALNYAKGAYYLMLNSDAFFNDNSIKKLFTYMEENEKVGISEGLEYYEDGRVVNTGSAFSTPLIDFYELSFIGKRCKSKNLDEKFRYAQKNRNNTFAVDVACDAFSMIRSSLFKKLHGYDESLLLYYTENDLCLRAKKLGWIVTHYGDAHVIHTVSVSANKLKWNKLELYYQDMLHYYIKHSYLISGWILFILLQVELVLLRLLRSKMFN